MKLHSIELRNVRGIRHAVIDDIPDDGVLIIDAPNESGKSSVTDAIEICLTEKHTAKKIGIRDMVTYGTSEPVRIRLEMTLDGRRFIVDKSFINRADSTVEILAPADERRTLKKAAADEWLEERRKASGLDDLWNAFTADQRGELNVLKLNDVGAMTGSLAAAARAGDVGADGIADGDADPDAGPGSASDPARAAGSAGPAGVGVTSADARAVMAGVEKEYRRFFTDTGRPSKSRRDAADELDRKRGELAEVAGRREELDRAIGEHERLTAAIAAHEAKLPEEEAEAADAAGRLARAEEAQARLDAALERLEARRAAVTAAVAARDARRAAEADAAARAAAAHEAEKAARDAEEAAREAEAGLKEAEEHLGAARAAVVAAEALQGLAHHDAAWRAEVDAAVAARGRLDELDRLTAARDAARRALEGEPVTAELADRVRAAETDLRIAADRLAAAAASMTLTAAAPRTVGVDGEDVHIGADAVDRTVDGETTLTIDDVTVVVRSGHDAGRVAADRDAAQAALAALLEQAGCGTAEEVREAASRHTDADDALRRAETELTAARRSADPEADRELVARVLGDAKAAIPADPGRAAAWRGEGEPPAPPADSAAAAEASRAADAAVTEARAELQQWEARAGERRDTRALEGRARAQVALEHATEEAARAAADLAAAREVRPDADLVAAAENASADLRESSEACDAARAAVAEASPEAARIAADVTRTAVENRHTRLEADTIERARMEERISGAVGLDDRITDLTTEITSMEDAEAEEEADAESWRLLRETLRRAEREAMREYQDPLLLRLRELAEPVFGAGVDFTLDSTSLAIVDRMMPGEEPVPFESLSGGAQEQCDILMRLAAASVIDVGEAAPVILDDSLTYSDATRLKGMGAAIMRAAAGAQVIVLTCDAERFRYVKGELRSLSAPEGI